MQDFGEQVQVGMHFDDGSTGATMHNRLPVLFHRATFEAVRAFERRHPRRHIYWFTRNGYSGHAGLGPLRDRELPRRRDDRLEPLGRARLADAPTCSTAAIGGAYGFTTDIGGFFDVPYGATEQGAVPPLGRVGGALAVLPDPRLGRRRHPHAVVLRRRDAADLQAPRAAPRRAEPLIMRLWRDGASTGMPVDAPAVARSIPADPRAAAQDQEWLLGPDLLVAPVVEEGATRGASTSRAAAGGRADGTPSTAARLGAEVEAPLGRLPWFTRCGTDPLR